MADLRGGGAGVGGANAVAVSLHTWLEESIIATCISYLAAVNWQWHAATKKQAQLHTCFSSFLISGCLTKPRVT